MWVGILINNFTVVIYIIFYGKECMNKNFARADVITYSIMNFFGLISGCFFGDALRRIWVSVRN
jgi:hypothetical protein